MVFMHIWFDLRLILLLLLLLIIIMAIVISAEIIIIIIIKKIVIIVIVITISMLTIAGVDRAGRACSEERRSGSVAYLMCIYI